MKKKFFFKNLFRLIKNKAELKFILFFINFSLIYFFNKKKINIYNLTKWNELTERKKFSQKWFLRNIFFLDKYLTELKSKKNMILEIGSFEGISAVYFLKNFENSCITCVDPFTGSDEHEYIKDKSILEQNFDFNLSEFKDKFTKVKTKSEIFFKSNKNIFDILYIDGSHEYYDVYNDAINSYSFCKKGGYLIFDDYFWTFYANEKNPLLAINKFYSEKKKSLQLLFLGQQIIFKKLV